MLKANERKQVFLLKGKKVKAAAKWRNP